MGHGRQPAVYRTRHVQNISCASRRLLPPGTPYYSLYSIYTCTVRTTQHIDMVTRTRDSTSTSTIFKLHAVIASGYSCSFLIDYYEGMQ